MGYRVLIWLGLIYLAFACPAVISKSYAQEHSETVAKQRQTYEDGAYKFGELPSPFPQQFPSVPITERKQPDTAYHEPRCSAPQSYGDANLCEQRRMAEAAEVAIRWTAAQTVLGILGFAAVIVSLVFAGKATRAASQQVALSRQALTLTERAFVYCTRIDSKWTAEKETEKILSWTFTPIFANSGKQPTKNTWNRINARITLGSEISLPDDFDFPDFGDPGRTMIAPQAEMHGNPITLSIDQVLQIRAKVASCFVWGWCEYDDIFPDMPRHRCEFCFEIEVPGNPIYKEGGFTYRQHGPFNGFDDECYRQPNNA